MKSRNIKIILILLTIGLFLTGCKKESKNEENQKEKPEEVKKLKIVDEDSTSRPFAVMVNNLNNIRYLQSGLQDAYIVYEIIVEGGITRYMALFMDQNTERIGSVRSARPYFLDYALENDAFYVHHGQSTQAESDFKTLTLDRIVVDDKKTGWRDKALKVDYEHTLFTSIEKLKNGIGNKRTTRNNNLLLNYSVDEIDMSKLDGATEANNISISYSKSYITGYTYDAEKGYYLRSVNNKEHSDYVTKEQYHVKNIITYQVKNNTISNDAENKNRQELHNIGKGTGYFISGGYSVPINWVKESRESQTKYYFMNGEELKVNDGNTFIQIQPVGQNISIS